MEEADKALLEVVKAAAVVFEVVGVNVGDNRHHRLQMEEGGVGFVRFRHQILAVAEAGVAACGGEHAADDKGRVQPGIGENRGNQAGSGGLAVGTGDGDAEAEAHQLRQHFRTADDRNAQLSRAQHFRVGRVNRRRGDDDRGVFHILRRVTEKQLRSLGGETLGIGGRLQIRTAHRIAQRYQHFGNRAHADTADADEKDIAHPPHLTTFDAAKMKVCTHSKVSIS